MCRRQHGHQRTGSAFQRIQPKRLVNLWSGAFVVVDEATNAQCRDRWALGRAIRGDIPLGICRGYVEPTTPDVIAKLFVVREYRQVAWSCAVDIGNHYNACWGTREQYASHIDVLELQRQVEGSLSSIVALHHQSCDSSRPTA